MLQEISVREYLGLRRKIDLLEDALKYIAGVARNPPDDYWSNLGHAQRLNVVWLRCRRFIDDANVLVAPAPNATNGPTAALSESPELPDL
jgi:hypothetical protein